MADVSVRLLGLRLQNQTILSGDMEIFDKLYLDYTDFGDGRELRYEAQCGLSCGVMFPQGPAGAMCYWTTSRRGEVGTAVIY